jgi:MerR family transcriptional regulator, copper efflux regulator
MRVGEVARRAGVSPRAVRLYEAEGVLPRAARTAGGYRTYGEHELELLRFVARLRAVGLGLGDIRELVRLRERGVPPSQRVLALLHARLAALDRTLRALDRWRAALAEVLEQARSIAASNGELRLCRLVAAPELAPPPVQPSPVRRRHHGMEVR